MQSLESRTDAELLAETERNAAAFAVFYRRYALRILSFLQARTRNAELSADLTAEVFANALEAAPRFDKAKAGGDSAAAWLFAIAQNSFRQSVRRGKVADEARLRLGMATPLTLQPDDIERIEILGVEASELRNGLDALPPHQRHAVVSRVVLERDYAEIAAEVKCSPLVVRKRVSRGLATLRNRLQENP